MRAAGVIGWPVAHSKSPLIHRFWLAKLGIDGDYGRFAVAPERLGEAIRALPALGLTGVNVTVPHKVAAMAYLDRIDPAAVRVGAINTVVVSDGERVGHNTDVGGVQAALMAHGALDRPCIIGTGGAARAALASIDAHTVDSVSIVARDKPAAMSLLAEFDLPGRVWAFDDAMAAISASGVVINATTLGMKGHAAMPVSVLAALGGAGARNRPVFDMVYTPLTTPLLAAARAAGHPVIDGFAMLIAQAAAAFALFFGAAAPREHDAELRVLLTT